jgi:hypothetical protein
MHLAALALLGIAFGAAGSEFLRSHKPELIEKMEKRVRLFVSGIMNPSEPKNQSEEQE